jgi:hypothetical protein
MIKMLSNKAIRDFYFSDPVSEFPLTYRGELIDKDSIFNVGAQRDCFESNKMYKLQFVETRSCGQIAWDRLATSGTQGGNYINSGNSLQVCRRGLCRPAVFVNSHTSINCSN